MTTPEFSARSGLESFGPDLIDGAILRMHPGDLLALRWRRPLTESERLRLSALVQRAVPDGVTVLIIDPGEDVALNLVVGSREFSAGNDQGAPS